MTRLPAWRLLADLRHRGARVGADDGRVRLKALAGVLSPEDRETIALHKAGVLEQLQLEERLLNQKLSEFQRSGCPLEIEVPGLNVTIWFVPQEEDAEKLAAEGIRRGRIWTAAELLNLWQGGYSDAEVLDIARVKLKFSGEVVDVRRDAPTKQPEPTQTPLDLGDKPPREFD